jgi:speckle-type POZ protein
MRDRNSGHLEIKDIEPPVFKALLHFIYRDVLPEPKDLVGSSTSTLLAQHLLAAADRYGLERLRLLCESKLCENVSTDTVATTLALAEQHHAAELKAVCLKFAASNLAAVMHSEGFEYLRDSCPTLQSELLKTVAGVYDESGGGAVVSNRNRSVWGQLSDGTDAIGRRVRPRT